MMAKKHISKRDYIFIIFAFLGSFSLFDKIYLGSFFLIYLSLYGFDTIKKWVPNVSKVSNRVWLLVRTLIFISGIANILDYSGVLHRFFHML